MTNPDPIRSMNISVKRPTSGDVSLSPQAIEDLQKRAQDQQSSARSQEGPPEAKEAPEIEQPRLGDDEREALLEASLLAETNKLQNEMTREELSDVKKTLARNKQLESRLKPIRLSDVLLRNFVQQEVPVADGYVLTFRTIDARIELEIEHIAREATEKYAKNERLTTYNATISAATLACGLMAITGAIKHAMAIHEETDTEKCRELIRAGMQDLMRLPQVVLQDMYSHQALFTARVRKVFNHAGYLPQQVGNF